MTLARNLAERVTEKGNVDTRFPDIDATSFRTASVMVRIIGDAFGAINPPDEQTLRQHRLSFDNLGTDNLAAVAQQFHP